MYASSLFSRLTDHCGTLVDDHGQEVIVSFVILIFSLSNSDVRIFMSVHCLTYTILILYFRTLGKVLLFLLHACFNLPLIVCQHCFQYIK